MLMSLFWIIAVLVIAGLILYFIRTIPGIDPTILALIRAVVIIICVVFVLYFVFGLLGGVSFPGHHPFTR
ncbi:MAG TPA: hypothetical protein VFW94_23940 [Candidatus Acidoferrales bacterium]|nr:hypothetical protein [Candidatus Acidoferrales bacterium]